MNFKEYISNPMGKQTRVMTHLNALRSMYIEKLDTIMVREAGKFDYKLYELSNCYICHAKIPSEVVPDFYYDTVIQMDKGPSNLEEATVRFYSNDPAFVFTFAHAFIENKMFIDLLKPKMSKQAVNKVAKERNPNNESGYVKSIYFAYMLMRRKGLFSPQLYNNKVNVFNKDQFINSIMHADDKIRERQIQGSVADKQKNNRQLAGKRNQENSTKISNVIGGSTKSSLGVQKTPTTSINKSNKVSTIKKTKRS